MVKIFLDLMKTVNSQLQEVWRTPNTVNNYIKAHHNKIDT